MSSLRRALRAYPALLRIGILEAVAYRTEFIVWILTTTIPLVMLALWSTVASEAPGGRFGRFASADFVAYYLGAFIVRTATGSWVVWEINHEIRTGVLSMRLLRPIHPLLAYSAEHLASVPLRAALALPMAVILLVATGGGRVVHDPLQVAMVPLVLAGVWALTFFTNCIIGTLGLWLEQSVAVFEVWLGVYALLSGYLVPLELMPRWVGDAATWLPFRYMLGFPVQVLIGMVDRAAALRGVGVQAVMIAVLMALSSLAWRGGLRRFEAYGA